MTEKTARTWDSYKPTLIAVMDELKPTHVLEYGPGESSKIILSYPCVEVLDSFEHDKAYYDKWRNEILDERFCMTHEEQSDHYVNGSLCKHDLIFIDGKWREACISSSKAKLNPGGAVMVHDAERRQYHKHMRLFKYIFMTDDGSTATMTDEYEVYRKLLPRLMEI